MTRYYAKLAGPLLGSKLAQLSQLSPDERYALCEEVDASRVMVERALRLFEQAHFPPEGEPVADVAVRVQTQELLRKQLGFVGEMVAKATKARSINVGTVDVEQLAYITDAFTRIIEEEIAVKNNDGHLVITGREMADRIVDRVREIKMPDRSDVRSEDPATIAQNLRNAASAIDSSVILEPDDDGDED